MRGGPSAEYPVSLKSGEQVLLALEPKYQPVDIWVSKSGEWNYRGEELDWHDLPDLADVVFNALHGPYGEDGELTSELEAIGLPYTGSAAWPLQQSLNKKTAKEKVGAAGLLIPKDSLGPTDPDEIFKSMPPPWIGKPLTGGSSLGVELIPTYPHLQTYLASRQSAGEPSFVEQYIKGREVSCAVIRDFRGQALYTLPPVEIRRGPNQPFDYEAKYGERFDQRHRLCPAPLTEAERATIQDAALLVHKTLGLGDYSMSDFMLTPRGLYFIEVNALPGLTERSLLPQSLKAVGATMPQLVDHIINLAINRVRN